MTTPAPDTESRTSDASAEPQSEGSLFWRLGGVIKTMRPHQWLKNSFVLAPVVFAKDIFRVDLFVQAIAAFSVFCLLAGAVYAMNDIVDVEADRIHPVKRHRPIASGRVPVAWAKVLSAVLVVASLGCALVIDWRFAAAAAAYFANNVAYNMGAKKIAYVDVGSIAAGFVLRVVAGGYATHIHVSRYLLACTLLLALFLGFGKRRHELAQAAEGAKKKQREALEAYTPRALTVALALTGTATVACYLAYTLDPTTREFFRTDWLWMTSAFTILGMGRFLQLVTSRPRAESPTQEMLRDVPFILVLVGYVLVVITIVYRLKPSIGQ